MALAAHDEVLRKAIEAHGGCHVQAHRRRCVCRVRLTESAVDAAVAAQRALELPVRMGIATGEAELRGGDYFGAVLNRAARVMAAGHGGQSPAGRFDGESARRGRATGSGSTAIAGLIDRCRGFPGPEPRDCGPHSRRCGPWMRRRGTCARRPPASLVARPSSPRSKRRCGDIAW